MAHEESKVSTPPRALLSSAVQRFPFARLVPSPLASPGTSSAPRETHREEASLLHPPGEQVSLGPLGWVVMALSPTHVL